MSTFLNRLRRAAVAIPILIAVAAIFEYGTLTTVPVASKNPAPSTTATCALSGTSVGAPLVVSGSGYAPNTSYAVEFIWPTGATGYAPTNSDSSGAILVSTYAWWSGSYEASVFTTGHKSQLMASCSTTIS